MIRKRLIFFARPLQFHQTRQLLQDVAPWAVDFLYLTELLRAEVHNLFRLEITVGEQVGQTLFPLVRQQASDGPPEIIALASVFGIWFTWFASHWL
jgi:hypothetical protein